MIGNRILLDTNIIVDLFRGNLHIFNRITETQQIDIPFVVLTELIFGAYKSKSKDKHLAQIERFVEGCNVLHSDERVTEFYAEIKVKLLAAGKPIPENDIWIAAIAKRYKRTLITRDNHFKQIPELAAEYW